MGCLAFGQLTVMRTHLQLHNLLRGTDDDATFPGLAQVVDALQ